MKKLMLLFVLFISFSCQSSVNNFDKIKKGMKSSEVIKLVGNPKEKMPMFICEWWMYDDVKKHIVVIGKDTVTNITTKEELKKGLQDVKNFMDSLAIKK